MFCSRCGARLQQGLAVCSECGARQVRPTRIIRCARCRGRAAIDLTVCPHCGRNLTPAGPRWGLWILLTLLVAFAAYRGWWRLPFQQAREQAISAQAQLAGIVQLPELATPTATATSGRVPPTALPTATRTLTSTATRVPSTTPTATPAATPTSQVAEYVVQAGDSLALIGQKLGIAWETIATLNGITSRTMLQPGDKLKLPSPTAAAPTATPPLTSTRSATATVGATTSAPPTRENSRTATVSPTIALANTVVVAATPPPTATPRPPTATSTPAPTSTPQPQLRALLLVSPGDGASYGENAQIMLQWQNRDYLPPGAIYRVSIMNTEKGAPVARHFDTTATTIQAPPWLLGLADQPARQYGWSVRIVQLATDGKGGERVIELNPQSEIRTFYWK